MSKKALLQHICQTEYTASHRFCLNQEHRNDLYTAQASHALPGDAIHEETPILL